MSTVTTGYVCDVCGAPANHLYADFTDGQDANLTPATAKEAYCDAHVPADWHVGEACELPPNEQEASQ